MIKKNEWVCLFIFLVAYVFKAEAQVPDYHFSRLGLENGLSNNRVQAIFRDSVGFLWFGTASGLNRFDGYRCKVFRNVPSDTNSIADNNATAVFPLPHNLLWVGSNLKPSVYDYTTDKFSENYQAVFRELGLPQNWLYSSFRDEAGSYWFHFREGLFRYGYGDKKATLVVKSLPNATKVTSMADGKNGVWLSYDDGTLALIDRGTLMTVKKTAVLKDFIQRRRVNYRVLAGSTDKIWCYISGEPKGVYIVDLLAQSVTNLTKETTGGKLKDNLIEGLARDQNGNIWVATDHGGVSVLNEHTPYVITTFTSNESQKNSISYNSIQTVYEDGRGIVWIGTVKKGVNYLNLNVPQFELFSSGSGNGNDLPYDDINGFVEDKKGNIWIATNGGGLLLFDRKQKKFTQFRHDPADPGSLSNDVIVSIFLDHDDKLWLGTYYGGLNVFDGNKFVVFKHDSADSTSISDDRVWSITEDHSNQLWVATLNGGLNRYDRHTNKFIRYLDNPSVCPVPARYIPFVKEDRSGNLWMGTGGGLLVFNKARTALTSYSASGDPSSLSHNNVSDWMEDMEGIIWVGTRDGLNVFNRQLNNFSHFSVEDGLPDNEIISLTEDGKGDLWVTTAKGLCQLLVKRQNNTVSFQVRNFAGLNNVQGADFNKKANLLTKDGAVLLGGTNGFNLIYPQKISYRKDKPTLVFTNVEILNNELSVGQALNKNIVLRRALLFADEIVLNHSENIFSVEFAALDFTGSNQYAYKLEGFNNRWIYAGSDNRKITYTNLDPGIYYFKVKATNSDGVFSDEVKELKIVIKPPFWRTPAAFLLYAFLVAGGLYLYRKYALEKARMTFEVEQQKREAARIQSINAIKTKVFTNVSHEFRTPLSLILSPLDKLNKSLTDPELLKQVRIVQRNAGRLLKLVNQLLDFRKMEVQEFKLEVTEGNIIKFSKEIVSSFSDLAEMKSIEMVFVANVESLITFFDKDKLEKILFNLLSNALKYTGNKGSIVVDVLYDRQENKEDKIIISVKDSGIGIPADKQEKVFERFFQNDVPANITNPGTGIGLAITKEFVRLHNGTIQVQSQVDIGTTFIVTLPAPKAGIQHHLQTGTEELSEDLLENEPLPVFEKDPALKKGRKAATILLVEDNDDFRFYLKDNLQQFYQVEEAINGQEAWEKLQGLMPDLIVSDIMMPILDGIELTNRIKKSDRLSHLPIVLLTAVEDEELQLESARLGVSEFMTKPFIYDLLASRVKKILAAKKETVRKPAKIVDINPREIHIEPHEEQFMKQVLEIVENNIGNPDFSIEDLSKAMFTNRVTLYRRLLALTGKSPLELVRNIRMKRAYQILGKSGMNVSEVAYEVGFNSPNKFSSYFKEEFGLTPSQFQKQAKKN